jgi:anti-sigma factor RsiW
MESDRIHELTAPYALDALDPVDEQRYREHLRSCARCRRELAALRETAAALALAAGGPVPPPGLRDRILAGARASVRRRRPHRPRSLALALTATVLAGCASIGLGAWSLTLSHRLHATRSQLADVQQVAHLMSRPGIKRVALSGRTGQLLVAPDGEAALVTTLDRAPSGSLYEVWVVTVPGRPRPAGAFRGGDDRPLLVLSEPVQSGAVVMITIEHAAGPPMPTSSPVATAQVT